jgi:hypothetical protein
VWCAADARRSLHRRGTLYTWTTQGFMPKEPYSSTTTTSRFAVPPRLRELPEQVRVEGRLINCDLESVHIGMEMS